jgi:hypothetical protein
MRGDVLALLSLRAKGPPIYVFLDNLHQLHHILTCPTGPYDRKNKLQPRITKGYHNGISQRCFPYMISISHLSYLTYHIPHIICRVRGLIDVLLIWL